MWNLNVKVDFVKYNLITKVCIMNLKKTEKYCPYFVKRGQPTKYQFDRRSKKVVPFYIHHMLCEVEYSPPILVILEDGFVIFLLVIEKD